MEKQNWETMSQFERGKFHAPWEKVFNRIMTPFEEFIQRQTSSSLLVILAVVFAIIIANSPLATFYEHLMHLNIDIHFGDWILKNSLQHWINDGLMTFFFFLVGLELKREILVGELAVWRQALLPVIAAIGGMVVPVLIYFSFNPAGTLSNGWAIPMATDIVFAVSALAFLGNRIPKSLFTFLVALAIIDDLGAIFVIAVFHTQEIVPLALLFAAGLTACLFILNRIGVRKTVPYFFIGALLWFALLQSGVHATLAGVIAAFSIPGKPKYSPSHFIAQMNVLMISFINHYLSGKSVMTNMELRGVVQSLKDSVRQVETPLQHLEHQMHVPVAFFIIPLFAFFNAGIPLELSSLGGILTHSVTLGIVCGLVFGKFFGVSIACWLALKSGITQLPSNTRFGHIAGVALLSGIGFTMSIFIAELSFIQQPELLLMAKTGILFASLLAGFAGFIWLCIVSQRTTD